MRGVFILAILLLVVLLVTSLALKAQSKAADAKVRPWYQHAVFYEIYPRSFRDSNDDGIGDLNGIRKAGIFESSGRGCDLDRALLSVTAGGFRLRRFGLRKYRPDVRNAGGLRPAAKTGEEAWHQDHHGLRGEPHLGPAPWFIDSRSSRTSEQRDWYIWRDGKGHGQPPNNWIATFGGRRGSWTQNDQYYYHYFYPQQPDLNWRNPAVEDAMYDMTRVVVQARRRGIPAGRGGYAV